MTLELLPRFGGLIMASALLLTACGGSGQDAPGGQASAPGGGAGATAQPQPSASPTGEGQPAEDGARKYFDDHVHDNIAICRTCHVPGGTADTPAGRRLMFRGAQRKSRSSDYDDLRAAWELLGRGVTGNRILTKASDTDPEPHSGGRLWPTDGPAYAETRDLLHCWAGTDGCPVAATPAPTIRPTPAPNATPQANATPTPAPGTPTPAPTARPTPGPGATPDPMPTPDPFPAAWRDFFASDVEPNVGICRGCHVPGGTAANDPDGDQFLLSADRATDFEAFHASWERMGGNNPSSRILIKAAGGDDHFAGALWPAEGAAYAAADQLLACFGGDPGCTLASPGGQDDTSDLLGSARAGHVWYDYCQAHGWEPALALPLDPRSLVMPGVNQGDPAVNGDEPAVYFNAFWKDCHVDADEDAAFAPYGSPERLGDTIFDTYEEDSGTPGTGRDTTDFAAPQTCGEFKRRLDAGAVLMGAAPWNPEIQSVFAHENAGMGFFGDTDSPIEPIAHGHVFGGDNPDHGFPISGDGYRSLWQAWGLDERPDTFDQMVVERYGFGGLNDALPYPLDGEDPDATGGGSGRLPVGLIQLRNPADGSYTGNVGVNCQGCHGVQIDASGTGAQDAFIYGGGGAMLDLSTFGRDLIQVGENLGMGLERVGVAGRVRGTNNAQFSNVTALVGTFRTSNYLDGFNSVFFPTGNPLCLFSGFSPGGSCAMGDTNLEAVEKAVDVLSNGATGTGDTPAWWNVGRRTVKFVDAMGPADAHRVDMALFFPLTELEDPGFNPLGYKKSPFDYAEAWTGEHSAYVDTWAMTRKSPAYPLPVDEDLAKAGAILFHNKDLREDIPAEPAAEDEAWAAEATRAWQIIQDQGYTGNGSCASCHGAYAPRFVNDPAYLEDPSLEGIAAYVVPINAIGTDRARFDTYMDSNFDPNEYAVNPQGSPDAIVLDEGSYDSGTNRANANEWIFYQETASAAGNGLDSGRGDPDWPVANDCRVQNLDGMQQQPDGSNRPLGYTAPPLYGVWATGPYFHNGSVPTVNAVLNSRARPRIWRRKSKPVPAGWPEDFVMGFDNTLATGFDPQNLGWKYDEIACLDIDDAGGSISNGAIPMLECSPDGTVPALGPVITEPVFGGVLLSWNVVNPTSFSNADVEKRKIYNTNLYSQGNGGHRFSDGLSEAERRAIIEYLKTL